MVITDIPFVLEFRVYSSLQNSKMPRKCVSSVDIFCYICGEVNFSAHKRSITLLVKAAYYHYFGVMLGNQDNPWAPHICSNTCLVNLCIG